MTCWRPQSPRHSPASSGNCARTSPRCRPRSDLALTKAEMGLLDRTVPSKGLPAGLGTTAPGLTLSAYLAKVARLGGYLARTRDPPPGNLVMWRGWSRLADLMLGAELAKRRCG